jgi:hypothetical protein
MPKLPVPPDVVRVFRQKPAPESAWYSKAFLEHYASSVLLSFNSSSVFPRNCLHDVTVSLSFEGLKPGQHALSFTGKGLPALLKLFPALRKHRPTAKQNFTPLDEAQHDDWCTSLGGPRVSSVPSPVLSAASAVSPATSSPIAKSPKATAVLSAAAPALVPTIAEAKASAAAPASTPTSLSTSTATTATTATTVSAPSVSAADQKRSAEAPFTVVTHGAKAKPAIATEIKTKNTFSALADEEQDSAAREEFTEKFFLLFGNAIADSSGKLHGCFVDWFDSVFTPQLAQHPKHYTAFDELFKQHDLMKQHAALPR